MPKKANKIIKRKWFILPILALLCFALTELLNQHPEFVEQYYSQGIYPIIAIILSTISGIFPFSLDDIFYTLLTFVVISLILLPIFKKLKFKKAIIVFLNILTSVYLLFYLFWGFNYYRLNLTERLDLQEKEEDLREFVLITEQLIEATNTLHCAVEEIDKTEVNNLIEASYKNLSEALQIRYPMGERKDKQITFSNFYAKTGITGYFGPFFNEVHVNKKATPLEYPFILAHEKAHQFGITSEAEANFYAWLVCTNSRSKQLKYSANLMILRRFLIQAYSLKEYKELVNKIDDSVKQDINEIRRHWLNLRNEKMDKAASKVNDAYLKTNKVKGGIKDYQGVVEHVMNFSLDAAFQERHNLAIN